MKIIHFVLLMLVATGSAQGQENASTVLPKDVLYFSQAFLLAIKTEQPYEAYRDTLARIDLDKLENTLNSPEKKLAFWINTYNSLVQAKIRDNPAAFSDQEHFFKAADQKIGGNLFSLDDLETGILRKKKRKHHKAFFKSFRVEVLDPRIHFTLNCGATSCPPVAFYSPERLEDELAAAEQSFVSQTSTYDATSNTATVSELFSWFAEDFGGNSGVTELLQRLNLVPAGTDPIFAYSPYDWHLDLENY